RQPARLPSHRHDDLRKPLHVAADGIEQRGEKEPRRDRRFQRAAALADDEDRPAVQQIVRDGSARRSHEIQKPLRGIVVHIEALEREPGPPPPFAPRQLIVERMAA
ncbi:MAG: hypothetical protein ACK559_05060, partial [bacterium]